MPHCSHYLLRIKGMIDLIMMTTAYWIVVGICVQNCGMQEAPTPFLLAKLNCSFVVCGTVWCFLFMLQVT